MSSKANQAVKNNHTMTATLPSTLSGLVTNSLCFLLFGSVLTTLNPLIILILIATAFINYLPQKYLRNYMHKTKDKREAESRKLMYYSRLSENFRIAKDVRLFSMDKWLTEASKLTSCKYKKLLLDLENKSFFGNACGFCRCAASQWSRICLSDMARGGRRYLCRRLCVIFFGHIQFQRLVFGYFIRLVGYPQYKP